MKNGKFTGHAPYHRCFGNFYFHKDSHYTFALYYPSLILWHWCL